MVATLAAGMITWLCVADSAACGTQARAEELPRGVNRVRNAGGVGDCGHRDVGVGRV